MITVDTINPVYSNLGGKTAEQKKESRAKAWETTKNVYGKAKESGLLQSLENLALKGKGTGTNMTNDLLPPPPPPTPEKTPMSMGMKIGIGVGVVAVGFAIYWFAIRKK